MHASLIIEELYERGFTTHQICELAGLSRHTVASVRNGYTHHDSTKTKLEKVLEHAKTYPSPAFCFDIMVNQLRSRGYSLPELERITGISTSVLRLTNKLTAEENWTRLFHAVAENDLMAEAPPQTTRIERQMATKAKQVAGRDRIKLRKKWGKTYQEYIDLTKEN